MLGVAKSRNDNDSSGGDGGIEDENDYPSSFSSLTMPSSTSGPLPNYPLPVEQPPPTDVTDIMYALFWLMEQVK